MIGPRHRRSRGWPPTSRPSTCSGRPPWSGRRSPSTTRRSGQPAHHPPPAAVGRGPLLRALVRRRPRHRPRRGADVPALPGRRARRGETARPGSYEVPPGTDVRAVARRLAPAPLTEPVVRPGPGGHRPGPASRGRRASSTGSTGPDGTADLGRLAPRPDGDVADEVLGYGRRRLRRSSPARGCGRRGGPAAGRGRPGRRHERAAAGGAKDQVARLLTLVPYLHAREEVRLDEAAADARGQPRTSCSATSGCC